MKKTVYLWVLVILLFLSACSSSASTSGEKEVKLPVTADLPKDRKVGEIILNVPTKEEDFVRHEYGFLLAEEWKKLGLDVIVEPLNEDSLSRLTENESDFDVMTGIWHGQAEKFDPDFFIYRTLHSTLTATNGDNKTGYKNPGYDVLAEGQRTTLNQTERKEIVTKAEDLFLEDIPYAPVIHRALLMAYNEEKFTNFQYGSEEGLNSFWTFMAIEPTGLNKYVRWAYPREIESLNPLASTSMQDFQVTRLIYDTLVKITDSGEPENWGAKSVEDANGDGLTYLITLREGMKFHDGEKVTAKDVQFSFNLVKEVESAAFSHLVEVVDKVEVVDELSVRITLKEAFAPFVNQTLSHLYIFPQHYWGPILEKEGPKGVIENKNEQPIGSGPFKLAYWEHGKELKLDADNGHFSPAKVNGILRILYSDTEAMLSAVKNGQAEIGGVSLLPEQAERIKDAQTLQIAHVPTIGLDHIIYNNRIKPFDDKALRKALTLSIPKETIVEEILQGAGKPANSLISPANGKWHSPDLNGYEYNLTSAVDTLKEAGYKWDEKGKLYYPEGKAKN
ncbi:MAG: ABC transporter substrate-binding protein [Bacillota bacterium]